MSTNSAYAVGCSQISVSLCFYNFVKLPAMRISNFAIFAYKFLCSQKFQPGEIVTIGNGLSNFSRTSYETYIYTHYYRRVTI